MTNSASIESLPGSDAHGERPHGIFERLGDWLNPVLVKEVRQAQRGRVFTVALVATVLITLLSCVIMALDLSDSNTQPGRSFFTVVYVFVCGAMMLVVPFQAFSSMGSEWDDHTYEMLVLSNLKPRQIVMGKLLAAVVQSALLLAVFLPFLATAFLLRGVDMLVLGVVLALTAYASVWLSTFSIMLSAVTRNRLLRVLLMVMLGGGLASLVSGAAALAQEFINRPDQMADTEFWIALPQILVVFTLLGVLAFVITCNLLAHEEENRSSNVRILGSVAIFALLALVALNVGLATVGLPREGVFGFSVVGIFALTAVSVFLCSEPERLGRRVGPTVPRRPWLAFLTLPWYPGGGRGAAYLLLHLAVLVAGGFAIALFAEPPSYARTPASSSLNSEGGAVLLLSAVYAVLYTLVPIGILAMFTRNTSGGRKFMRTIAFFSPFLYVLVPAIFGLVVGSYELRSTRHVGNPVRTMAGSVSAFEDHRDGVFFILLPLALFGIVLALPKILRAVRETATARQAVPVERSDR
ncbi:ABC-2 family transporter protein [Planctomycetes bacterium Poly30]|uniref:ABC-2 family transporter protein n=1 Tax=Saltatorellus ferox TaxID=2528018 RepID=A0A518EPI7_9BACT|nr:ABC-2 family transporter protein [Planctomycetes bacterium Poly30]